MALTGLDRGAAIPGLALALGGMLTGCPGGDRSGESPALRIAVSVPPLADLVEEIGGDAVDVVIVLPPGTDPHSFEISPRRAAALEGARLAVSVGSPAFPWEDRLAGSGNRPVLRLRSTGDGSTGPHRWLDLAAVERLVGPLVDGLAELDPTGREGYRARGELFRDRLAALRGEVAGVLDPREGEAYFVDHAAWGPLTRPHDVEERALATGHRETTPGTLARRIDEARRVGATTLFVRPGRRSGAAESFLEATGTRPVVLDPLGRPWEETIRAAARSIAEALRER